MTPVKNQENLLATAQCLLAYLSDDSNSTPNNMLEGIVSGKSLLRAIISGQLIVCEPGLKKMLDTEDIKKLGAHQASSTQDPCLELDAAPAEES